MRRVTVQIAIYFLVLVLGQTAAHAQSQAATPVFVQPAGSYPIGQLITITDATPGATIYVGVHGVIPTTRGTKYTGPFAVADVETVRAIAVAPGYTQSEMAVAKYTAYPTMTAPTLNPPPGAYITLPSVMLSGTSTNPGYYIYWTIDGSTPTQTSLRYETPISITNGTKVSAMAVQPYYFQSPVVSGVYQLKVQTPVFTPPGGTQLTEYSVTIADPTPGASIYYTTDGSTPTTASTPFTGPITVSRNETLNAIATLPSYADSAVGSAAFTIAASPQIITPVAGDGTAGYSGDGGQAVNAKLDLPKGLVFDKTGNLYIADEGNHVIRKIAAQTGIITTAVGTGVRGSSGDGGQAVDAELDAPVAVAIDSLGNLYIGDVDNGFVRKVDAVSGVISFVAGNATAMLADPTPGQLATTFRIEALTGLALDSSDNLYLSDQYSNHILRVDHATGIITIAVGGSLPDPPRDGGPALSDDLYFPAGLTFDQAGHLYLSNVNNNMVNYVDFGTEKIYRAAGMVYGQGFSGDGGLATSAMLFGPMDEAFDSAGNLYIVDTYNQRLREVFASSGDLLTIAGDGTVHIPPLEGISPGDGDYGGDGGVATAAKLNTPEGVAVDAEGNIYIADTYNHAIRKVNPMAVAPSAQKPK